MGLDRLSGLYRQVLLDHAHNPRNKRSVADYTGQMELLNPTCGDAIVVQYRMEDDVLVDVGFTGYGCSISIASASMMTEVMKGQTLEQAEQLIEAFNYLIGGSPAKKADLDSLADELKDAYFLEGVKQFPARYKCAVLAWKALEMGIGQVELLEGLTVGRQEKVSEMDE
ncbi:SUF system NifU family Fe-S cluster assembly protein [Aerococcaceae bacterium NML191292]|nr:SUF system NifU family Fe-S cluster assembly protein [Aerococcaceae bacterium NML191292]MCW6667266.1 SUF system NifU family Fe-S cluster assembly protein [Aerococcaceae bacterium NML190938]